MFIANPRSCFLTTTAEYASPEHAAYKAIISSSLLKTGKFMMMIRSFEFVGWCRAPKHSFASLADAAHNV
jgi:hypothetical protein